MILIKDRHSKIVTPKPLKKFWGNMILIKDRHNATADASDSRKVKRGNMILIKDRHLSQLFFVNTLFALREI